ncbi:hypothetical protein [Ornithinimicrobium panacihumi]|uniref:hypothetical protein n=1 Tax=Ornithinimicrobium panacihumi TaxID=2008449 RepID=UPI003F896B9E
MDRLLFGDNQFFGVNHMSEEKARAQAVRFQDLDAIMDVLACACEQGISTFMCTTHDRIADVVERARQDPDRFSALTFYPGMPYAHKYANAVTEDGMIGAVRRFMPQEGTVNALLRGGASMARRDIEGVMTLLIDAEMKMFAGARTPVIFLQNVVVDLLLGLEFTEAFAVFARHVRERYGAEPGFITMNLPMLVPVLERAGMENPLVCANINKLGFRMSGGIRTYIEMLEAQRCRAIAMSVFASGAIPPREALEWVAQIPAIQSVVFGASSAAHIESTARIARDIWGLDRSVAAATVG